MKHLKLIFTTFVLLYVPILCLTPTELQGMFNKGFEDIVRDTVDMPVTLEEGVIPRWLAGREENVKRKLTISRTHSNVHLNSTCINVPNFSHLIDAKLQKQK